MACHYFCSEAKARNSDKEKEKALFQEKFNLRIYSLSGQIDKNIGNLDISFTVKKFLGKFMVKKCKYSITNYRIKQNIQGELKCQSLDT